VAAADGKSFDWRERMGAKVCDAARESGLLTRPIQDVVVFMPPLCVSPEEIWFGIEAIRKAVEKVCSATRNP
jgi:adenosylmethionine-8-amino-7-oxononanoate aminotransferase